MGGIYHDGNYYAGANANDRAPKSIITSDTAYNPSKSYVAGDWFIDGDVLYEVKTACQGITPPNATYYEVKTVHDLQSEIDALESDVTDIYSSLNGLKIYQVETSITFGSAGTATVDPGTITGGVVTTRNLKGFVAQISGALVTGAGRDTSGRIAIMQNGGDGSKQVYLIMYYA